VVGWIEFKIFRFAYKWVRLGWSTKWPTRGGSSWTGPNDPFWQL